MKKYLKIVYIFLVIISTIILINCKKNTNYDEYLYKIWIPQEWNAVNDYNGSNKFFSFYITEIEDGKIEGRISTQGIVETACYYYSLEEGIYASGNFTGTIRNGIAKCDFCDVDGSKGSFELVLRNGGEVKAIFEFENNISGKQLASSVYNFRAYNLSDKKEVTIIEKCEADLNSWGRVQIVSGRYDTGKKYYGVVYLTNDEGDIFYEFHAPFHTGLDIVKINTGDINGDGLIDVKFFEGFEENEEAYIEWNFLQREDRTFYSDRLINEIDNTH